MDADSYKPKAVWRGERGCLFEWGTEDETSHMVNDRLQFADGEQLLFEKSNPTFHRFSDLSVAVSEAALYWQTRRLFGGTRWLSFPLSNIKELVIRPAPFRLPWVRLGACLILATFPVMQLVENVQSGRKFLALITGAGLIAICVMGWYLIQGARDRVEMEIKLSTRSVVLETPADNYADEKTFDRKVLRELGDYLKSRGVRVVDQCQDELSP